MAYSERTFMLDTVPVTLKSWLPEESDYTAGFNQYTVVRHYVAWAERKVTASQCYIFFRLSEVKDYLKVYLNNVMTISIKVTSQSGVRLFLPRQVPMLQAEVLAHWRDMGVQPAVVESDSATPVLDETRNIDDWWNRNEYNRKRKKAVQELERLGHPAAITFEVDGAKFETISDGTEIRTVRKRDRKVQVP